MAFEYSKIRTIYVPIFNYKFDHGPSEIDDTNQFFTGRKKVKIRIQNLLSKDHIKSKHGAYLLTGYRGMGKTSTVREALNEKTGNKTFKEQNGIKPFYFSLSQDVVKDIDLLRQIAIELISFSKENVVDKRIFRPFIFLLFKGFQFSLKASIFYFLLNLILFLFYNNQSSTLNLDPFHINLDKHLDFLKSSLSNLFKDNNLGQAFLFFGMFAILLMVSIQTIRFAKNFFLSYTFLGKLKTLDAKITSLESRLFGQVSREETGKSKIKLGDTNPFTSISNKILDAFDDNPERNLRQTVNYSIANSKELEIELKSILETIDEIREKRGKWFYRMLFKEIESFLFVVDELDKIEPDYFFIPGDRETDEHLHHIESPFHITTKARKRQEAIAKLLANLKNFLNDAKAKFIFIGGRDMYDAALADISDRESFYSSIFNEVIYIETFFKDKNVDHAGLSHLTEEFIGNFLFPAKYHGEKNLKNYLKIIKTKEPHEKFKILHLIQNFLIFLLYRSNGSPKKLIELFERYVVEYIDVKDVKDQKKALNLSSCRLNLIEPFDEKPHLMLKFSYKSQYEINLTSSLYRPYTILNSRHLKAFGDKLLYSSAFLMDHILKFHKTAFSWRNLELIPDIILANKDPNFRRFFQDIMLFLSNQHIRKTLNAIHQYKFFSKVKNEMQYLSKVSEFSSAAFNFTLDESFHLKSYYKKKLASKYLEYKPQNFEKSKYIHSIGYLHSLIGDLHFYDEEYDDAIIHYTDAVQLLRPYILEEERKYPHQFMLYTRNQISLGFCLEKSRSYDKAYSIFRHLTLISRNLTNHAGGDQELIHKWEAPYKRMQLYLKPHIAILSILEKQRTDGITYDNLVRNIEEYATLIEIENLKPFPLSSPKPIDYDKLKIIKKKESSDDKKNKEIRADKKRLVTLLGDYYLSVGTLLYYKNHTFYSFLYENKDFKNENYSNEVRNNYALVKNKNYRASHASYLYYLHALEALNAPYYENLKFLKSHPELLNDDSKLHPEKFSCRLLSQLDFLFFHLEKRTYPILNANQFESFGNILSKLGDTILASICAPKEVLFNEDIISFYKSSGDLYPYVINLKNRKILESYDYVFFIYRLAYYCYRSAGNVFSGNFQLKKTLYALRDAKEGLIQPALLPEIEKLVDLGLSNLTIISDGSNRAQISKYRARTDNDEAMTSLIYKGISTEGDVKEILLLYESILSKNKPGYICEYTIGPFSTISNIFSRILELKTKAEANYKILKSWSPFKEILAKKTELRILDQKEFLQQKESLENVKGCICDGLFCCYQLIKILNTYSPGYILTFSFLASVHRLMGHFSSYYLVFQEAVDINPTLETLQLDEELNDLIGLHHANEFDPYLHYDLARQNYQKGMDLHSEGKIYKVLNREMYVLDDDFNDNLTHFCTAMERHNINIERTPRNLKRMEELISLSRINFTKTYRNDLS
jgi:hypothetical protein